jgi:mannitol/fructose-specific phosphotransferase system IIA component (Ntr-type)
LATLAALGTTRRKAFGGQTFIYVMISQPLMVPEVVSAVALLIFLLVPEAATQKHLEILSEIAELLSDSALREQIMSCASAGELHAMLARWQSAHAAH